MISIKKLWDGPDHDRNWTAWKRDSAAQVFQAKSLAKLEFSPATADWPMNPWARLGGMHRDLLTHGLGRGI